MGRSNPRISGTGVFQKGLIELKNVYHYWCLKNMNELLVSCINLAYKSSSYDFILVVTTLRIKCVNGALVDNCEDEFEVKQEF